MDILCGFKLQVHKSKYKHKKSLRVYSVTSKMEKILPEECCGEFTTEPYHTRVLVGDLLEHSPDPMPCGALLYLNADVYATPSTSIYVSLFSIIMYHPSHLMHLPTNKHPCTVLLSFYSQISTLGLNGLVDSMSANESRSHTSLRSFFHTATTFVTTTVLAPMCMRSGLWAWLQHPR